MDDPYLTLGIPRNATPDQIKKAWRRKAAAAHPDREGGDAQAMTALSVAYEVLSDPAKREQYDKNGTVTPTRTPNDKAREWLCQLLMQFIQGEIEVDVIEQMRLAVAAKSAEIAQGRAQTERLQDNLKRRLKRLKGPPDNFMAYAVSAAIAQLADKFAGLDEDRKVVGRAVELLGDFSYELEESQLSRFSIGQYLYTQANSGT